MKLFKSQYEFGSIFLATVAKHVSPASFESVRENFDAYADIDCSLEKVLVPLQWRRFPGQSESSSFIENMTQLLDTNVIEKLTVSGLGELFSLDVISSLKWSINEHARYVSLSGCDSWEKSYFSALYIYCDRLEPNWNVESDYFYLMIEDAIVKNNHDCTDNFICFIEWLYEHVPSGPGYDDYFALLCWLLLKRWRGEGNGEIYKNVAEELLRRRYSSKEVRDLTVCERNSHHWFALQERIQPSCDVTEDDFQKLIYGID